MKHLNLLALFMLMGTSPAADSPVTVADRPDTTQSNKWYPGNKPPLQPSPFIKLPVGAVEPKGWLRKTLELQNEGFHGHLTEISEFLKKEGNAWLSKDGTGSRGWEEVPYWLKGFGDCAYLLGDRDHIAEAKVWIDAAISSQRDDGFFGPRGKGAKSTVESTKGQWDLWPNMPMLDSIRSYYEFTKDERVLPFMAKYFRWELALPEEQFLPPYWQQVRAYDNLWSVYWLYNRTKDAALQADLLKLAEKIHRRAARWDEGVINWHNVNVAEGFGGPAFFWMQSNDPKHLNAAEKNFQEFRAKYGQVPGGLFGADENARPGYTDPHQAVETCGMVEFMFTCERLLVATGNPIWADRCEDVAFNSLPAALTADMKALRYLTAPNMATADRRSHSPGIENGGPMFHFDPTNHRCCQHNFGHGWPYFAQHLVMATPDSGLCVMFPLAGESKAEVGKDGDRIKLSVSNHYPLTGNGCIQITVSTEDPVRFPLYLRVPGWCADVSLHPGESAPDIKFRGAAGNRFLKIDREWKGVSKFILQLHQKPAIVRWAGNQNAASVNFGPLTFSLLIDSTTRRAGGSDQWPGTEILPTGPWNYALDLGAGVEFDTNPKSNLESPWTTESAPLRLKAKGRKIPQWQFDRNALVGALQPSPVKSSEPLETLTLVPMGAARIRISAFPVLGDGADAKEWAEPKKAKWSPTASHCYENDSSEALSDGIEPKNSADQGIPRMTFWPHKGTKEWVQYDFGKPMKVSGCDVYWFDDTGRGGCALPRVWSVSYKDAAGQWQSLVNTSYDNPAKDKWNKVDCKPVETTGLRLEVQLEPDKSGGILEWKVRHPIP